MYSEHNSEGLEFIRCYKTHLVQDTTAVQKTAVTNWYQYTYQNFLLRLLELLCSFVNIRGQYSYTFGKIIGGQWAPVVGTQIILLIFAMISEAVVAASVSLPSKFNFLYWLFNVRTKINSPLLLNFNKNIWNPHKAKMAKKRVSLLLSKK